MARRAPLLGMVFVALCVAGLSVRPVMAGPAAPAADAQAGTLCARAVAMQEKSFKLPSFLLQAISMVESGRYDDQSRAAVAWPWTVNNGGVGKFFPTKAAAIAEVHRLRKAGETNIDVGCMQINLHYHADAFASLEEAFDPFHNAAYAAAFLTSLYPDAGSWLQAAAHYHSQEPTRASYYRGKVAKAWDQRRRLAGLTDGLPAGPAPVASGPLTVAEVTAAMTGPAARAGAQLASTLVPTVAAPARAADGRTADLRKAAQERTAAEAAAAQKFAAAWREAKLKEWEDQRSQRAARAAQQRRTTR